MPVPSWLRIWRRQALAFCCSLPRLAVRRPMTGGKAMDTWSIRQTRGRGRLYDSLLEPVGDPPTIRINRLGPQGVRLYVKAEFFNPASSVKDRLALNIIE